MKKFTVIFALAGLWMAGVSAQSLKVESETLNYSLYVGPLKGGEAKLVSKKVNYQGQETVRMDLIANTTKVADKIYSLHDTLTTFLSLTENRPVRFQKHCYEGDDIVREKADFNLLADGTYSVDMRKDYKNGRVKERTETSVEPVYDMVSIVAFARSIDPSSLRVGQRIGFKLASSAEIKDESLVYQGKEQVRISGKKYDCMIFRLVEPVMENGKTRDNDVLTIYVNDDPSRTIIQMDIKFKVGAAKVKINP